MERKQLTLGLFGFGCVGYGLYEVLQKTPGLKTTIKNICVKDKNKVRQISAGHFTYNKWDILNDPDINVVIELIDDADAAYEIVTTALKSGKAVVTANKKMIAEHFQELLDLQKEYDVPLLYEAACCASIPIIRNLEEYYDNDLLQSIEGIVNGSTNYILTKVFAENQTYAQALKDAQALGFAESNPILDTGGFDAKYKLLILIAHAFGIVLRPADIFNLGIDQIGELELQYAREKGYKIKLVAEAVKTADGNISFLVMPKFVNAHSKLHSVDDVYNGVVTKTSFADIQFFVGKGAGAFPTASAVLSDISALTYNYRYEYKKINQLHPPFSNHDVLLKVLLRYNVQTKSLDDYKPYFTLLQETYINQQAGYITGIIALSSVKTLQASNSGGHSFILYHIEDNASLN